MNRSWPLNVLRSHRNQAFICISLTATVLYRIYYVPKLTTDDWAQLVAYNIFNAIQWFSWPSHRPLHMMPYKTVYALFGVNAHLFHVINLVIYIGVFFLIYLLMERLFPDQYPFALVVALLALVYPADFTMSWINMISHRLAWLLGLVGMWFLIEYASKGRGVRAVLSSLIMLVSLLIYEGALGILIAWIFLLALIYRRLDRRRWLGLLTPLLGIIPFIWLRLYYLPKLQKGGPNLVMFNQLPTVELLDRLGGISVLIRAWSQPFRIWLRGSILLRLSNEILVLGIILAMVFFTLSAFILIRALRIDHGIAMNDQERRQNEKRYGWASLFAVGFILAGYFPIIFVYPPNLEETVTRANMYAIPAAAALIVALASLVILGMTSYKKQWQVLIWAMILPLMLIGIGVRVDVQKLGMEAWIKQEVIWQKLFELAPDLKDGTTVVFFYKGRSETIYGHLPIYAEWEATSALQTLYQNPSLNGLIYSPEMALYSEAVIKPSGVVRFVDKKVTPYDQTVFVVYDVRSGRLRIMDTIANHLEYNPWNRIMEDPDKIWRYRYLVGVD
jgi:hypothetical protein